MKNKSSIKVSFSPISIIWLIFLIISKNKLYIPLFSAVVLHELGHIVFTITNKLPIEKIKFSLFGAEIKLNCEKISYKSEFWLAFFGPFFGFIGFLISLPFIKMNETLMFFSFLSLFLSLFNLIPIKTFDGGRMIFALLSEKISNNFAERTVDLLSFISIFSLYFCSVYFLIKYNFGISIFIFSIIIFIRFFVLKPQTD